MMILRFGFLGGIAKGNPAANKDRDDGGNEQPTASANSDNYVARCRLWASE